MLAHVANYLTQLIYIIEGYIIWGYDELTGKATKRSIERMKICNICPYNNNGICKKCGCILQAKTRVNFLLDDYGKTIDGCPEKKW